MDSSLEEEVKVVEKTIQLDCITMLYSLMDLVRCLSEPASKIAKRLARYDCINHMYDQANRHGLLTDEDSKYIANLNFGCQHHIRQKRQEVRDLSNASDTDAKWDMTKLDELRDDNQQSPISIGLHENNPVFAVGGAAPDTIRREFEGSLTEMINATGKLWNFGCVILYVIQDTIAMDDKLGHLLRSGHIIVTLKGGVAMLKAVTAFVDEKLVACRNREEISHIRKQIAQCFKIGDNDTSIYIDPDMVDFDIIHERVADLTACVMDQFIVDFARGKYNDVYDLIYGHTQIDFYQEFFDLNPIKKKSFTMKFCPNKTDQAWKCYENSPNFLYRTRNHALQFVLNGKKTAFTLCRIKARFTCNHVANLIPEFDVGAEVLDVSINQQDDFTTKKFFTLILYLRLIESITIPCSSSYCPATYIHKPS